MDPQVDIPPTLDWVAMAISLLGGLAFFMYGMQKMTDGLKVIAGDRMRTILSTLTTNRFTGVLTGALVTAVIQSSSITAVLIVGFVSAGVMSLTQSVGVIMGANIGTTVTAQIIAFKVTKYALVLVIIGFAGLFVMPQPRIKQLGSVILGLGLIFYGMDLMSVAAHPLRTYPPFINMMQDMTHPIWGILIGMIFTAIVQSSSATTGIVIVLSGQGLITLEAGIALIFGANIGTCITSYLSALGKPREAMQAAGVHVIFNILGVLLWIALIPSLAEWVRSFSPIAQDLVGTARLAAEAPRQIANAHTVFNIANTLIFIGLAGSFARVVKWVFPDLPTPPVSGHAPQYLDDVYLETPGMALDRVRMEMGHLGKLTQSLLRQAPGMALQGNEQQMTDLIKQRAETAALYLSVMDYMERLTLTDLSREQSSQMRDLVSISNYLDSIADTIENNILALGDSRLQQNLQIEMEGAMAIQPCTDHVVNALGDALHALVESDVSLAEDVINRKDRMKELASAAIETVGLELSSGTTGRLAVLAIETELVELLKHLFYFSRRIARGAVSCHRHNESSSEPNEVTADEE
jgi:phosphate:Na+ symporter